MYLNNYVYFFCLCKNFRELEHVARHGCIPTHVNASSEVTEEVLMSNCPHQSSIDDVKKQLQKITNIHRNKIWFSKKVIKTFLARMRQKPLRLLNTRHCYKKLTLYQNLV